MEQVRAPSVEHGEKADLGPQVLGISADGEQGLRGGAEQDAVEFLSCSDRQSLQSVLVQ